ncbi:MAG: bifunctional D-glycero-beta-D-manno-heptose-7-phosphate kinase/D-glycero-beta-D-manno-heptose 1-phosphate adenylyltransferase HldE [Gammaproteobacteria bacterium]
MHNSLIENFSKAKVLVVGDLMLDRYWSGATERISPEAPVPVVKIGDEFERLGGSGNVAANIAVLGGEVHLLALVGRDAAADSIEQLAEQAGIDCQLLRFAEMTTTVKLRIISQQQQLLRLDFEKLEASADQAKSLGDKFSELLPTTGAVVLSDYGKGGVPYPAKIIEKAREQRVPVLVDPKGRDFSKYRFAHLVTPNFKEFEEVVGECRDEQTLESKARALISELHIDGLLITRGHKGMTLVRADRPLLHLSAQSREVFDVTGAGDTVCGVCATSIAAGADLEEAIGLANRAAGIVVGKFGTATVSVDELRASAEGARGDKSLNDSQIAALVNEKRKDGMRIVMTNGCFDVLHAGHVEYLRSARTLGDFLVVAVNTDRSVRELKGHGRPVNNLADRLSVLSALEVVDALVSFDEATPLKIIKTLAPDVLVKGGDYQIEDIVGGKEVIAKGGEVRVLPFVEGLSSSGILTKLGME